MAVNAFTGEDDGVNPLQSIMSGARNVGTSLNESPLLADPASRSALLQIGLGLMQPMAMGQSVAGHIGQAIGGGGEAETRLEAQRLAEEKQQDELEKTQRTLDIRQQEADAYTKGTSLKNIIDRQALEADKAKAAAERLGTKNYAAHAHEIFKTLTGAAFDPTAKANEPFARFVGKNPSEIEDMLRTEGEGRKGGGGTSTMPMSQGSKDDEARAWATANPNDPRAARIRERLGM